MASNRGSRYSQPQKQSLWSKFVQSFKEKKSTKIITGVVVFLLLIMVFGGGRNTNQTIQNNSTNQTQTSATQGYVFPELKTGTGQQYAAKVAPTEINTLLNGDLLSVIDSGYGDVVIKARVYPLATNKETITQNYYNVCDFIRHADLTGINDVQYWAVSDFGSGEGKILSLSVSRDVIDMIQTTQFTDSNLGNYVQNDDYFVIGSLKNPGAPKITGKIASPSTATNANSSTNTGTQTVTSTATVDKSQLQAAILEAWNYDGSQYTPESYQNMMSYVAADSYPAQVFDNPNATQGDVDTATATLRVAINGLQPVEYQATVDKSELAALINEAWTYDGSQYTDSSYGVMRDLISEGGYAASVFNDPTATQDDVNNAVASLQNAIYYLDEVAYESYFNDNYYGEESLGRTVYITDTGDRYHSGNCYKLKDSKYPINIYDAQAQGYTPCGICKPGW